MRTRQKRVATDTWRSLGCRTTPLEHCSKRKPTVEPRWAKQQTKNIMRITRRCTLISLSAIVSPNRLNPITQRVKIDRSVRRALPVYDNGERVATSGSHWLANSIIRSIMAFCLHTLHTFTGFTILNLLGLLECLVMWLISVLVIKV